MARTGRPRGFDRAVALEQAMHLFWRHGYEATSTAQLREAMGGISSASFHAAFVTKETLFREALVLYAAHHGSCLDSLFDPAVAPRDAIEIALRCSVEMQTEEGHPPGCLVCSSTTNCSPEAEAVRRLTGEIRDGNYTAIRACVERAAMLGELAPSANVDALAVLFNGFLVGISSQARDGMPRASLLAAISELMRAWPAATAQAEPGIDARSASALMGRPPTGRAPPPTPPASRHPKPGKDR